MSVNIDPIECAAINAKTIPADNSDFKVCKNNIVIGERSHDGYKLELLNKGEDSSHTFLYLKDHNVYDDFEGFSNDEKKKLKKMGVEYVNLYGYGTDNTQYSDLVGNTVHVDELKSRKHQHREEGSSWGLWLIVFFIVFILIIILACSCVGSSSKAIYTTV